MKKGILLFIAICGVNLVVASPLVEKATIIDRVLGKTNTEELIDAIEKSSTIGISLASLKNLPSYEDSHDEFVTKFGELLQDGLGEAVIKAYSIEELRVIEELFDSGDVQRSLALRLLCDPIAHDRMLITSLNNLIAEWSRSAMTRMQHKKKEQ